MDVQHSPCDVQLLVFIVAFCVITCWYMYEAKPDFCYMILSYHS